MRDDITIDIAATKARMRQQAEDLDPEDRRKLLELADAISG